MTSSFASVALARIHVLPVLAFGFVGAAFPSAYAATPSTPAPNAATPASDEAVQLSPFLVSTAGDDGYRAANTLSGTRMNSSLMHTPAAISVLTKEFLDDIGAENVADMFKYAMRRGQALDLQLNVENLFRNEDRLPYSAATPGVVVRYILPRVRQTWNLRATFTF